MQRRYTMPKVIENKSEAKHRFVECSFVNNNVIIYSVARTRSDETAVDRSEMEKLWDAHLSCVTLLYCQFMRTVRLVRRFPIASCTYIRTFLAFCYFPCHIHGPRWNGSGQIIRSHWGWSFAFPVTRINGRRLKGPSQTRASKWGSFIAYSYGK